MNLSLRFFLLETKYIELELRSEELQGAHEVGGRTLGGQAPPLVERWWPPVLHLLQVFFLFSEKWLREVLGHSENVCSCT